jgi:DNA-binding transcriptional regulator YdaS (Cro superfamily)
MKSGGLERNKRGSLAVGAGLLLLVAGALAFRVAGRIGVTEPNVRVVSLAVSAGRDARRNTRYLGVEQAMTGEVSRTAERVNEAIGAATAASLVIASEIVKERMPADSGHLIAAMMERNLLPAFVAVGTQRGTLETANSILMIRYRRSPVGVEVVAVGKSREVGQAVLVRAPTDELTNESGIWLFEKLDGVVVPRPFALEGELLAWGWKPDELPPIRD